MTNHFNISDSELEEIDRFLTKDMTATEAEVFAARLETDKQLREKVDEVKLLFLGIAEETLLEQIKDFHATKETQVRHAFRQKKLNIRWAIAASVIFILALSTWGLFRCYNADNRLYVKYYQPDPGLMTVMSGETTNYNFDKAMVAYKNGDYNQALREWKEMLKSEPRNDTLLYFTASALQALSSFDEAITPYENVAADSQSIFQKDACWYIGLIYLRKGQYQKAKQYIEQSDNSETSSLIKNMSK